MSRADDIALVSGPRRRFHIVGIGGAGMSALALVLHALGHQVSGSDQRASVVTERLGAIGVAVTIGHDAGLVGGVDVVTISTAVKEDNPERQAAVSLGIPVWSRARLLAAVAALKRVIAVAGTHGKTTTTTMLSLILLEAGLQPSYVIGGDVRQLGTNAAWDKGEWLVVEADESDGTFLDLEPEVALVTNIEADHLDHFGTFDNVRAAFGEFLRLAPRSRFVGGDDAEAAEVGELVGAELVGVGHRSTWRMTDLNLGPRSVAFGLVDPSGTELGRVNVPVPGIHNARNAAMAAAAALEIGVEMAAVVSALARYEGVARRFEFRGEAAGVNFVDDYAHLPTEIRSVLRAARDGDWGRVVAVFQPHRYSRTAELWAEFGASFGDADVVVITDVYPAGEDAVEGVSGLLVADEVRRLRPDVEVHYVPGRDTLASSVSPLLRAGDLCLTLGAGDLTGLPDELIEGLGTPR